MESENSQSYELILTEKPKAAVRIAYALADSQPTRRFQGRVPYFELTNGGRRILVTCAIGHLYTLAEREKTKGYPVFDIHWVPYHEASKKGFASRSLPFITALRELAKNASSVTIACDYDAEGELIGVNILHYIFGKEKAARMKFSTLTKSDLIKSYREKLPNYSIGLATAGETRHFLDFYYGVNLSRALMASLAAGGKHRLLSIGRVQGPALALAATRESEIENFKPVPYWQIYLLVEDESGKEVSVRFESDVFDKAEAETFRALKGKAGFASTKAEEESWLPRPPFDLTTLQVEAYYALRLTPAQTLQLAQNLYLNGMISYPRTSSQKLPPSIGYRQIIEKLSMLFPKLTAKVTRKVPVQGKATDPAHPAIYPTGETSTKVTASEKRLYNLIVSRFLACFADDAIIERKKISVTIEGKNFSASGLRVLQPGWLSVYRVRLKETELPDIEGKITVKDVAIEEKETQPPRRYSAATLVSELAKRKLGTKATRALIVDTLYKRGYIKGNKIEVTELGKTAYSVLRETAPVILSESLTREMEEKLEKIQSTEDKAECESEKKAILAEAKSVIEKVSDLFKANEEKIGKRLAECVL